MKVTVTLHTRCGCTRDMQMTQEEVDRLGNVIWLPLSPPARLARQIEPSDICEREGIGMRKFLFLYEEDGIYYYKESDSE